MPHTCLFYGQAHTGTTKIVPIAQQLADLVLPFENFSEEDARLVNSGLDVLDQSREWQILPNLSPATLHRIKNPSE